MASKSTQWHTKSKHKQLRTQETEVRLPDRDLRKQVTTNKDTVSKSPVHMNMAFTSWTNFNIGTMFVVRFSLIIQQ